MTSIPEPECLVILDAANVCRKMIEYRIQTETFAEIFSTPDFQMANMLHTDAEWLILHLWSTQPEPLNPPQSAYHKDQHR